MISENTIWQYSLTSSVNIDSSLSDEKIETMLKAFKTQQYRDAVNCIHIDIDINYPITIWQVDKEEQVRELFYSNFDYEINRLEGKLNAFVTPFQISFPDDFDEYDVRQYMGDLHRIQKAYLLYNIETITSGNLSSIWSDTEKAFFQSLLKNQKKSVKKISVQ